MLDGRREFLRALCVIRECFYLGANYPDLKQEELRAIELYVDAKLHKFEEAHKNKQTL